LFLFEFQIYLDYMLHGVLIVVWGENYFLFVRSATVECVAPGFTEWSVCGSCEMLVV